MRPKSGTNDIVQGAQQGDSLSAQMPTIQAIHCFQSLFNDPEFSDIKIKAEDAVFFAHRAVLAAHSPSFKAMFMVRGNSHSLGISSFGLMTSVAEVTSTPR